MAWYLAHQWWFLTPAIGFVLFAVNRVTYHLGALKERERDAQRASVRREAERIAQQRSWDALGSGRARPIVDIRFEGDVHWRVEMRDGKAHVVIEVPREGAVNDVVQLELQPVEAGRLADALETVASTLAETAPKRRTAWDRLDDE
jgi:hypothetical protein